MNTTRSSQTTTDLTVTRVLATLLERMDRSSAAVDAQQYQSVVSRLVEALADAPPGDELNALLDRFPSAGELYENLQYRHAGLCRSALDPALAAELQARQLLDRLKARPH